MTGQSGGNTSTTSTTSGPPPQVLQAYQNLVGAATNQATQPLVQYTGPMIAGLTPQQQTGLQEVHDTQGIGVPYINSAAQELGQATAPLWPGIQKFDTSGLPTAATGAYGSATGAVGTALDTARNLSVPDYSTLPTYYSPYTQQVTDATRNLFNQQNATRASQISGDAASKEAYGGDREAVAQALATREENMAQAPVLAGIQQSGFQQAQQTLAQQQAIALQRQQAQGQLALGAGQGYAGLGQGQFGEFNTQQQQQLAAEQANRWLASQAAFGLGGLGTEAQTLGLQGAQAELGAGALQQQLGQETLNVPYQQFLQAQAYPYQQLGFLAPIVEGTGSLSGGIGKTTSPGPSPISQIAGLGAAGAGIAGGLFGNGSGGGSDPANSGPTPWVGENFGASSGNPGIYGNIYGFGPQGGGKAGGRVTNAANGGRIGYAAGGSGGGGFDMMTEPEIPGIGQGVPTIDVSYIPHQEGPGNASKSGLSPFDNITHTTQTQSSSGGGGGVLGALGTVAGIFTGMPWLGAVGSVADRVTGIARGGRIGEIPRGNYDDGGSVGTVGIGGTPRSTGNLGLPPIPAINLDYIVHPGPAVKGSGPPKPPAPPPTSDPMKDASGIASAAKSLGGLFGEGSKDTASSGGRIGFDAGGGVPLSAAVSFGGAPPNVQQSYQQLLLLPLNRLQEMAVQFPPNSQQGQLVAKALASKKATVGSGTAPVAPPSSSGASATGDGTGALGSPTGTGSGTGTAQTPQDYGGTAHLAIGGPADSGPGYVTPDELDPHPIVDHSGDTVKIRYPSEGKVLDLGLPPIREERGRFPTGGAVSYITAPNGVAIPQLPTGPVPLGTSMGAEGGGLGNWFQPQGQWSPPGAGVGPDGSRHFPSVFAYQPQMAGLLSSLHPGGVIPEFMGGPHVDPAPATPSTPATPGPSADMSNINPINGLPFDAFNNIVFNDSSGTSGNSGGRRGGRVGFADGGDTDEFGMEDYVPPRSGGIGDTAEGMEDYPPKHYLGQRVRPETPAPKGVVAHADLPPTGTVAHADIPPEPVNRGAYADIPPSIPEPPPPRGVRAHADIEPEASLSAGESRRPPNEISPDTADILAERDREEPPPPFYGRGRPFSSLPSAPASPTSPYAYGLAPEMRPFPTDVSDVHDDPSFGLSLPPAGLGRQTGTAHADIPPPTSGGGIGATPPRTGGLGDTANQEGMEDYAATPPGIGAPVTGEPAAPAAMASPTRMPPTIPEVGDWVPRRGGRVTQSGQDTLPPGTKVNSKGTPYNTTEPTGGVPADTPGAKRVTSPDGRDITEMVYGKGMAAPPDAGTVTPTPRPVPQPTGPAAAPQIRPAGAPSEAPTAPRERASGEPPPPAGATGPVTPDLVKQAGYAKDPEGYAALANYLWKGEASDFNILYGGKTFGAYDKHPADKGWQGGYGPAGPTHAAGLPQFQPGTWHGEAQKLGLTDFGPVNQVKGGLDLAETVYRNQTGGDLLTDFKAGKLDQINSALHSTWTSLGSGQVAGPGRGPAGPDQMVGPGTGRPGLEGGAAGQQGDPAAQVRQVAQTALARTPPEGRSAMREWMNSPWFPVFLAGAGMLASRSPFPGVALGEGLLAAGKGAETVAGLQNKQELADMRTQATAQNTQIRADALAEKAKNDVAGLQFKYDNMIRLQQAGNDSLDLRRQMAAVNAELGVAKVAAANAEHDRKVEDDKRKAERDRATKEYHDALAARPPSSLALYDRKQAAWLSIHPGDNEGATRYAGGQHDMTSDQKSLAAQNLAQKDLAADFSAMTLTPAQRQARIHALTQFHLKELGAAAPAAPAAGPAAAPAQTAAPAAPAGGRTATGPNGAKVYSPDGTHWFTDPAYRTPYAASP